MKRTLTAIIAASALALGSMGAIQGCDNESKEEKAYKECVEKHKDMVPGKHYATGKILVGFDKGVTKEEAENFIKDSNLEVSKFYTGTNLAVVKVPEGKELEYACRFKSTADRTVVNYAELDYVLKILETPK